MKFVTEEQLAAHAAASRRGALEGTGIGAAIAATGGFVLQRRSPAFRALPPSLKALGAVICIAPTLAIFAERRGVQYDKSQWVDEGAAVLDERASKEDLRWNALDTKGKIGDWASRHEYSLILGAWALSIAGSGAMIARDKYQTNSQKVVQARMWAQGLTVGIMIVAGALQHSKRAAAAEHAHEDHSWREVIEEREREKASHLPARSSLTEKESAPA